MILKKDWDKFIAGKLEKASNFGSKADVMSEVSVRSVILDTLIAHGINLKRKTRKEIK